MFTIKINTFQVLFWIESVIVSIIIINFVHNCCGPGQLETNYHGDCWLHHSESVAEVYDIGLWVV